MSTLSSEYPQYYQKQYIDTARGATVVHYPLRHTTVGLSNTSPINPPHDMMDGGGWTATSTKTITVGAAAAPQPHAQHPPSTTTATYPRPRLVDTPPVSSTPPSSSLPPSASSPTTSGATEAVPTEVPTAWRTLSREPNVQQQQALTFNKKIPGTLSTNLLSRGIVSMAHQHYRSINYHRPGKLAIASSPLASRSLERSLSPSQVGAGLKKSYTPLNNSARFIPVHSSTAHSSSLSYSYDPFTSPTNITNYRESSPHVSFHQPHSHNSVSSLKKDATPVQPFSFPSRSYDPVMYSQPQTSTTTTTAVLPPVESPTSPFLKVSGKDATTETDVVHDNASVAVQVPEAEANNRNIAEDHLVILPSLPTFPDGNNNMHMAVPEAEVNNRNISVDHLVILPSYNSDIDISVVSVPDNSDFDIMTGHQYHTVETTSAPAVVPVVDLQTKAMQEAPPFWGATLDRRTAEVTGMWHDGPAYKAGIRPGDKIIRVAGNNVNDYKSTLVEMKKTKVGQQSTITVLKPNGHQQETCITPLTTIPAYHQERGIYYNTKDHYRIPVESETSMIAGDPEKMQQHAATNAPPFWGATMDAQTTRVTEMWHYGPAYWAGVRPGDRIIRIAGTLVHDYPSILNEMKKTRVGEASTITALKPDGRQEEYKITPLTNKAEYQHCPEIYFDTATHYRIPQKHTQQKKSDHQQGQAMKKSPRPVVPTTVAQDTTKLRQYARDHCKPCWGMMVGNRSTKVTEVWHDGPAHKANINVGDKIVRIGDREVTTYAQTVMAMKAAKVGETQRVVVERPDGTLTQETYLTPLTNRKEYKNIPEIYFDTHKSYKITS